VTEVTERAERARHPLRANGAPGAAEAFVATTPSEVFGNMIAVLKQASPPWWFAVDERSGGLGSVEAELRVENAAAVLNLHGASMRGLDGMFEEIGSVLEFPDYFGRNWAALDECLADLSWLPASAYVLLVHALKQLNSTCNGGHRPDSQNGSGSVPRAMVSKSRSSDQGSLVGLP
jgi:hypothetical protein